MSFTDGLNFAVEGGMPLLVGVLALGHRCMYLSGILMHPRDLIT